MGDNSTVQNRKAAIRIDASGKRLSYLMIPFSSESEMFFLTPACPMRYRNIQPARTAGNYALNTVLALHQNSFSRRRHSSTGWLKPIANIGAKRKYFRYLRDFPLGFAFPAGISVGDISVGDASDAASGCYRYRYAQRRVQLT